MRIVVVEDEFRIRTGVVRLIQKMGSDYEVVGEADNGLAGLELISLQKPDLVIADIKMPEMDGIEMLMKLKERGIKHKTVILSGYSDFEYAQKAIKTGVAEYLLKPITAGDLEQTMKNIEKEIQMERMVTTNQPHVFSSLENIFQNVVLSDNSNIEDIQNYLKEKYDINPYGDFAAISIYFGPLQPEAVHTIKKTLFNQLDKLNKNGFVIFELALHREIIVLIFKKCDYAILERYFQNSVINEIHREGIKGLALAWTVFSGLDNLKGTLNVLRKELRWSIVLGEDVLISYPKTEKINTKLIQYPIDLEVNAKSAACSLDLKKLKGLFDDFSLWWRRDLYKPSEVIEAFIRFASSIINVIKEVDYSIYEQINQKETLERIMNAVTWNELYASFNSILERISEAEGNNHHGMSLVIKKALSIINENYSSGISLEEIAFRLGITPEYLGSLFNKELGVNYCAYIKGFRINKAKKLIISTELRTYEIAEKVGYTDPKYFSKVFKEVTGLTPGEYKKAYK